jgi:hypothetical protein
MLVKEPPSTVLPPKSKPMAYTWADGHRGIMYDIGEYSVCVRWGWSGPSSAMLQVSRFDGGSVFDWRHLQQIKNQVCGDEWEAAELFPAESRLKDPSNARYLWCRKEPFDFGIPGGRVVLDAHEAIAPQRAFPSTCHQEIERC